MSNKLPFKIDFTFVETEQGLTEAISYLDTKEVIGIDTETTGLDPFLSKVLLIQIADVDKCFVFDCSKIDVMKLKPLLENEKTLKLLQNAKFDYKMIKAGYGIKIKNMFCTMAAEKIITTGRVGSRVSLKALVSKYLGITIDKEIRKQFVETSGYQRDGFSKDELEYAASDSLVLFPIYEQQVTELIDRELVEVAILEFSVMEVTAEMELAGVSINTQRWNEIVSQVRDRRDETHKLLLKEFSSVVNQNNLFGLPIINTNSPLQVLSYLKKLGVKTEDGKELPSTDESILSKVKDTYTVVKLLLDYKGDEKIISTYGKAILDKINPKTNRLHATFDQLRAATGRYSSSSPNLQNIPAYVPRSKFYIGEKVTITENSSKEIGIDNLGPYVVEDVVEDKDKNSVKLSEISLWLPFKSVVEYPMIDFRSCFVAPPGRKLITADYSQQEVRILADASDDPVFAEAYRNGEDIHTKTAAGIFGVPIDKVTKDQRKKSKTINFALIYGAGAWKVANSLNISEFEAQDLIDRYFKTYPGIKKFLHGMSDFAIRNGYSYTISGRKRYFSIPDGSHPEYKKIIGSIRRQAPNTFIQGCLGYHSKVLTKTGYLDIGDIVYTSNTFWTGTEWRDGSVVYSGEKELFNVRFGYSINSVLTEIEMTKDHKLKVFRDGTYVWVSLSELSAGDFVCANNTLTGTESEIEKIWLYKIRNSTDNISVKVFRKFSSEFDNVNFIPILDINSVGIKDCYDVMLNDEPHCFVANGIVCHNSAADVTKQALVYVYDEINKSSLDIKMLLIVHDEIVLEADEKDAKFTAKMLEDCMIRGFSTYFKKIPMKVDAVVADFWSKD